MADFDRTQIPSLKLLRCLPADLHGVIVKLHDALKEMRSCVFRIGQDIMQDAEIALVAGMPSDVLVSTLPAIIRKGMMARGDAGALYSPHFYDKLLRSEERAARKAQAEQDRAQWMAEVQAHGDVPAGLTPKQLASMINGRKGGRPRKNGGPVAGQKNMPFYGVVGGTEKAHKFVYFDAPVRQAIQQKSTEPAAKPAIPKDEAERQAQEAWKRAQPVWGRMMQAEKDLSVVGRKWPSVAQKNGFPDCPPGYDTYVAHFRAQAKGSEAVAA